MLQAQFYLRFCSRFDNFFFGSATNPFFLRFAIGNVSCSQELIVSILILYEVISVKNWLPLSTQQLQTATIRNFGKLIRTTHR